MFNLTHNSLLDSSVTWNSLVQSVFSLWSNSSVLSNATSNDKCSRLTALSIPNTHILNAYYVPAGSNIPTPGSCQSNTTSSASVCRVYGIVDTSPDSAVRFELWLPDVWYGRFLEVGNHALSGCKFFSAGLSRFIFKQYLKVSIILMLITELPYTLLRSALIMDMTGIPDYISLIILKSSLTLLIELSTLEHSSESKL
jgi:hypothetical protein